VQEVRREVGGVVGEQHARGLLSDVDVGNVRGGLAGRLGGGDGAAVVARGRLDLEFIGEIALPQPLSERGLGQTAAPQEQQSPRLLVQLDDGALDAHLARGALRLPQYEQLRPAEVGHHMLGARRRHVPKAVGAGRADRDARRSKQLQCPRARGAAHAHRTGARRHYRGQRLARRRDHRQRSRPEVARQPPEQGEAGGLQGDERLRARQRVHVHDERVGARSPLHLVDPQQRGLVEGVSPETVDRLRREGDELACSQRLCGLFDRVGVAAHGRARRHGHGCTAVERQPGASSKAARGERERGQGSRRREREAHSGAHPGPTHATLVKILHLGNITGLRLDMLFSCLKIPRYSKDHVNRHKFVLYLTIVN